MFVYVRLLAQQRWLLRQRFYSAHTENTDEVFSNPYFHEGNPKNNSQEILCVSMRWSFHLPDFFSYKTGVSLQKQSQRSKSLLEDGSRSSGLFWKRKCHFLFQNNPEDLDQLYCTRLIYNFAVLSGKVGSHLILNKYGTSILFAILC